jgi:hypothetical protein
LSGVVVAETKHYFEYWGEVRKRKAHIKELKNENK